MSNIASPAPMPIPIWRWPRCWPACITASSRSAIPGPPAKGNVSHERDTALPFSLADALARFGGDTLNAYLGAEFVTLYRETKRIEAERFARIISPAEYDWYL